MPKRTSVQTLIADLTRIEGLAALWRAELSRAARAERLSAMGPQAAAMSGGITLGSNPVPVGSKCPPNHKKPGKKGKTAKGKTAKAKTAKGKTSKTGGKSKKGKGKN